MNSCTDGHFTYFMSLDTYQDIAFINISYKVFRCTQILDLLFSNKPRNCSELQEQPNTGYSNKAHFFFVGKNFSS